jgi:hypothetical protein
MAPQHTILVGEEGVWFMLKLGARCLFAFLLLELLGVSPPLIAQTSHPAKTTATVFGARPVDEMIRKWQKQYGWVISYEDAAVVYAGNQQDATLESRKDIKPGDPIDPDKRFIIPKRRELSVSYVEPSSISDEKAELQAVNELLTSYEQLTRDSFTVRQSGSRLHIFPANVKDEAGNLQPGKPILDTVITIPTQDRSAAEFLQLFCEALTSATGQKVSLGSASVLPGFSSARIKEGYDNLPAWQILEKSLDQVEGGDRYTWGLNYMKGYYLNIRWVKDLSRTQQHPSSASTSPPRQRTFRPFVSADGTKTVYVARPSAQPN